MIFCVHTQEGGGGGGGLVVPRTERHERLFEVRTWDMYVCLRQLIFFITRENVFLA